MELKEEERQGTDRRKDGKKYNKAAGRKVRERVDPMFVRHWAQSMLVAFEWNDIKYLLVRERESGRVGQCIGSIIKCILCTHIHTSLQKLLVTQGVSFSICLQRKKEDGTERSRERDKEVSFFFSLSLSYTQLTHCSNSNAITAPTHHRLGVLETRNCSSHFNLVVSENVRIRSISLWISTL